MDIRKSIKFIIPVLLLSLIFGMGYISSPTQNQNAINSKAEEITEYQEAKCTSITDRDTIKVKMFSDGKTYKVRYIGMDTPEKGMLYYKEAKNINSSLVYKKTLKLVKDVSETDRYGRLLRYVYVGDTFVNAYLVAEGYAMILTVPPDVKYAEYFLELQQQAIDAGKGLWATATETTQETTGGYFVGSRKSDVYHYPDCSSAKQIKPENLITFNSVEEAKAAGYRPCKKCHPPG